MNAYNLFYEGHRPGLGEYPPHGMVLTAGGTSKVLTAGGTSKV